MSKIKDKLIAVYEVKAERVIDGSEIKIKRYINSVNKLHAYARELSEREKFAAKAVGAEQSVILTVNYNPKIKAGQHVDFNGESFVIKSVDGYEFYKRDLTLRLERVKAEVFDYEEFDER